MCPAYPADPKRPQPPVRLRYEHPSSRPRPVRPTMDPSMQILEVALEIVPVVSPRHPVNPRGHVRADRPIRLPQTLDADVVKQRGEPHIIVLPRRLAHTIQITGHAQSGTASGACFTGRVPLGQAPSLPRLRSRHGGFVRRVRRYYEPV